MKSVTTTDADTIVVTIVAPTTGQPWNNYLVKVCLAAGDKSCLPDKVCPATVADGVNTDTSCTVEGTEGGLGYTVAATAKNADGSVSSPQSDPLSFSTPDHE